MFKNVLIISMLVCLFFSGIGCDVTVKKSQPQESELTIGNNSFITIADNINPGDNPALILNAVKHFEDNHPQLEIISWNLEKRQTAYITSAYTYGIWVHHRPRK